MKTKKISWFLVISMLVSLMNFTTVFAADSSAVDAVAALDGLSETAAYAEAVSPGDFKVTPLEYKDVNNGAYVITNAHGDHWFNGKMYTIAEAKEVYANDATNLSYITAAETAGYEYWAVGRSDANRYEDNLADARGVAKDAWHAGRYCLTNNNEKRSPLCFGLSNSNYITENDSKLTVIVEYLDNGTDDIVMTYWNNTKALTWNSKVVTKTNTGTWKVAYISVDNARFLASNPSSERTGICSGHEDFQLSSSSSDLYVSRLMVVKTSDLSPFKKVELVQKVGSEFNLDFNYDVDTTFTQDGKITADGQLSANDVGYSTRRIRHMEESEQVSTTVLAKEKYLKGATWLQIFASTTPAKTLTEKRYFTEFKFKMGTLSSVNKLFRACTIGINGNWNQSHGPYLGVTNNNGKYIITAGSAWTSFALQADKWYNVKLDIDTPNKKFDVYVNGATIATDVPFGSGSYENAGYHNVLFEHMQTGNDTICLDDIKVYREPTGVITYGADDFSGYSEDVVYNGSNIYTNFAGLRISDANFRQTNFTIDSKKGYAIAGTGAASGVSNDGMQISLSRDLALYKQKSVVAEFKITPTANRVGRLLQLQDRWGSHHGIELGLTYNNFTVRCAPTSGTASQVSSYTEKVIGGFEAGETYNVKIVLDAGRTYAQTIVGGNEDGSDKIINRAGVCDIYINDKLALSDAGFAYSNATATDFELAQIFMRSDTQAYLDDFRFYTDEKELVISSLNDDIAAQCAGGIISTNTINLPTTYTASSGNIYKVEWTSSDNTAINASTGAVSLDKACDVTLTANIYYEGEEDYGVTTNYDIAIDIVPSLLESITPVDYEINSVTFTDANSNVVYGPSTGGKLTGVSVKKNVATAGDLYAAVYDGGKLTGATVVKNFSDGNIPLDINVNEGSEVKFFVWSNDNNLKPLIAPFDVQKTARKLVILSDSIYDENPPSFQPSTGVGLALKSCYNQENLEIVNLAKCGASLKTYVQQGLFANALNSIQRGDYVLLSFCHNDEKWEAEPETSEPVDSNGTAPYDTGSYEYYLEAYVDAIRLKGAIPIIATSIPRWQFDGDTPTSTHGSYYTAAKNFAAYKKVPLLDVYAEAFADLVELKAEGSKAYYLDPGKTDNTHMSEAGAKWVANIIVELADALKLPFSEYKIAE